jgi:hypothetical protein
VRRSPGNRPFEQANPEVWPALEKLVDPLTRGDPESPLRWTCKSTSVLAEELAVQHGIKISDRTVAKLLREHGDSLHRAAICLTAQRTWLSSAPGLALRRMDSGQTAS